MVSFKPMEPTSRGRLFCSSPRGRPPAALHRLGSAQWRSESNLPRCLRIPPALRCPLEITSNITMFFNALFNAYQILFLLTKLVIKYWLSRANINLLQSLQTSELRPLSFGQCLYDVLDEWTPITGTDAGTYHWLWSWPGQTSYELPSSAVLSPGDARSCEHRCRRRWSSRRRELCLLPHLLLTLRPTSGEIMSVSYHAER